jgi:hypothetical protein
MLLDNDRGVRQLQVMLISGDLNLYYASTERQLYFGRYFNTDIRK